MNQSLVNNKDSIDVLIICALKDEYDQVLAVNDGILALGWVVSTIAGLTVADASFSTFSGNTIKIRAAWASHMGRESASAITAILMQHSNTRCIAMCGICAGRRSKVALGDVIFADTLWSYDAGKLTVEEGKQVFQGDILQYRPTPFFVQRMQSFSVLNNPSWLDKRPVLPLEKQEDWVLLCRLANEDPIKHPNFHEDCPNWSEVLPRLWKRKWLEKPTELTIAGRERAEELALLYPSALPAFPNFQIHIAPIATGASVTEDDGIFSRLSNSMRKVLGIEMEASALGALGEIHNIPVIVAKGVSDYGDTFKDDRYRSFAARAAAECLIGFLRNCADLWYSERIEVQPTNIDLQLQGIDRPSMDLIDFLAEHYTDTDEIRMLWQQSGGNRSDVGQSNSKTQWQKLLTQSYQGSVVKPLTLLTLVHKAFPNNQIVRNSIDALKNGNHN